MVNNRVSLASTANNVGGRSGGGGGLRISGSKFGVWNLGLRIGLELQLLGV